MSNPVTTYQLHAQRLAIPANEVESHIEYMKKSMHYPPVQGKDCVYAQRAIVLSDIEVFAHGREVMRLAKAVPFAQNTDRQEWLVQSLAVRDNQFITQKAYPFDSTKPLAVQLAYSAAYSDAKNWYPAPDKLAHVEKWNDLTRPGDNAVSPLLNSREKLAEFWYESKAIDWNHNERPFAYEYDAAQYLMSSSSFQRDPKWNDDEYEEIQTYAWNLLDSWGDDELKNTLIAEGSRPIVITDFRYPHFEGRLEYHVNKNTMILEVTDAKTQETHLSPSMLPIHFPLIADVRGIDEDDKARIFKTLEVGQQEHYKNGNGHENYEDAIHDDATKIITYEDGSEGYFIAHPDFSYTITYEDKSYWCDHKSLDADTKFESRHIDFDNEYLITVYSVKYTPEDYERGESGEREELEVCEKYTTDDLRGLQSRYEALKPSMESPNPNDFYVWFESSSAVEDGEHFEKGIDTFFEVHVLEINGQPPTPNGLQRFADAMHITFSKPIVLPQSDFATVVLDKAEANTIGNTF